MLITVKAEMVLSSWQAPPNNTHTALQSTDIPGTTTQRDRWTDALLTTLTLHFSQQTYLAPLHRETGGQTPSLQHSHCTSVNRHTWHHYTERQVDRRPPYNTHTALQSTDIPGTTTQRDRWTDALLTTLTLHFSQQTYLAPLHRETGGQTPSLQHSHCTSVNRHTWHHYTERQVDRRPPYNTHTALQSTDTPGTTTQRDRWTDALLTTLTLHFSQQTYLAPLHRETGGQTPSLQHSHCTSVNRHTWHHYTERQVDRRPPYNTHTALQSTDIPGTTTQRDRWTDALLTTLTLHFSQQTYLAPLHRETGGQTPSLQHSHCTSVNRHTWHHYTERQVDRRPPYNTHTALQSTDIPGTTTQRDRWTDALLTTLTLHFSQQTYLAPLHRETGGQTPSLQHSHCTSVNRHTWHHYTERQVDRCPPYNTHTALQSADIPGTTTQRDRWTDALLTTLTLHFSQQTHPEPLHRETGGQRPSYQCSHCSLVIRHTQSHYTDRQMD